MPSVKCKNCQTVIETTAEQQYVVCPNCGSSYLNPFCPANHAPNPQAPQYDNQYYQNQTFAPQPYAPQQQPTQTYNPALQNPIGRESVKLLKDVSKSWLMLLLAITVTVTALFNLIDLFTHLKGLMMIPNIIQIILYVVLCTGVWMILTRGRSDNRSPSGFNCVKGYITTIMVFVILIVSLIAAIVFMTFGIASEIAGQVQLKEGLTLDTVLIIAIVLIIAVIVVISLFFSSIRGVLKSARNTLEYKPEPHANYIMAAVMLLLIGIVKFAWIFITGAIDNILSSILGAISENMSGLGSIVGGISLKGNWSSILVDVCGMLNYILGGILIIVYYVKKKKLQEASPTL